MREEIVHRLSVVLNALDSIPVSGKPNLANMSGSIAVIEEVIEILKKSEITSIKQKE